MRIAALALGFALVSGACASSGTAAGEQSTTGTTTTRRTNLISSAEISESRASTVADLIRQARPSWGPAIVFVNENPDPVGSTRSPGTVREIRYLTKSEAQSKWGSRVEGPVIQIIPR
jgi:hypothetical protein